MISSINCPTRRRISETAEAALHDESGHCPKPEPVSLLDKSPRPFEERKETFQRCTAHLLAKRCVPFHSQPWPAV
ncbi:hypothetical protein P7H06_23340 [Paenibacillus larvae]|nr:hypothetical protein [Paenibacillus larvae]MDT2261830.1 hypothetical protein [Paenibacillus larvae]